jgi:CRP/FNR family cyclic AMP-dependent transcriptional regulator
MNEQELLQSLREIGFCQEMDDAVLEQLGGIARPVEFPLGRVIFREGDAATNMYLIRSGHVALEICAPSVGCKRILTLGAGDLLGWSAALRENHLTATARSIEVTEAIELNAAQILTLCEHSPRFGYQFMRQAALALAQRLSATRLQLLNVYGSGMPSAPVENAGGP